jgi:type II secretion system protein G
MKETTMTKKVLIAIFVLIIIYIGHRLIISDGNCLYGELSPEGNACLYNKGNPITGLNCLFLHGSETRTIVGTVCSWTTLGESKVMTTKLLMDHLKFMLQEYYLDNNTYPTTDQGLQALVQKSTTGTPPTNYSPEGYIKKDSDLKDARGRKFIYESDGEKFIITSYGHDGKVGGDGLDEDITVSSD